MFFMWQAGLMIVDETGDVTSLRRPFARQTGVLSGIFREFPGRLPLNAGQIALHANVLPDGQGTTD